MRKLLRFLFRAVPLDRLVDETELAYQDGVHLAHMLVLTEQYEELIDWAQELHITFFATAFDIPSAEFLADLEMPAVKIASGDLNNIPLLEWLARGPDWPLILSTGGGNMAEVMRAEIEKLPTAGQDTLRALFAKVKKTLA